MTTLYYVDYGQGIDYDGDEENEEDVLIGVFSTPEKAQAVINRLKDNPLFTKYPNRFQILVGELNKGGWETGFVTVPE